jgi:hypothetical protein
MSKHLRISALIAVAAMMSSCVDHGDKPLLLPVGSPAQFPEVVHVLCTDEADAAYNRAKEEFAKRAMMYASGMDAGQLDQQESQANAAAHMKYMSCASSQGYRAIYQ